MFYAIKLNLHSQKESNIAIVALVEWILFFIAPEYQLCNTHV